jgi:hypothetical protein
MRRRLFNPKFLCCSFISLAAVQAEVPQARRTSSKKNLKQEELQARRTSSKKNLKQEEPQARRTSSKKNLKQEKISSYPIQVLSHEVIRPRELSKNFKYGGMPTNV